MTDLSFWSANVDTWTIGRFENYTSMKMLSEHIHGHHEISFNYSPIPILHTANGFTYETSGLYIVYRAPYTLHSTSTLSDETYMRYRLDLNPCLLKLSGGFVSMEKFSGVNEFIIHTTNEQMEYLRPLLDILCDQTEQEYFDPLDNKCCGLIAAILGIVGDFYDNASVKHINTKAYIQDVMYYVVENISKNLTIDALAERFFVSRVKICNDFRATTNLSLHRYITEVRISLAKMWLMEGLPLAKVAEYCGFSQPSSFTVMFRRITGITPGEYLQQAGMT